MRVTRCSLLIGCALLAPWLPATAGVVINEIFYHAPNETEDSDYLELYNPDDRPVDLSGWKFTKGIHYEFPSGTRLEAKGFLVLCRSLERFKENYGFSASGAFLEALSRKGERIELRNARGKKVDSVKYGDQAPWPTAADGYSASLERITPSAGSELPENWAGSPLSVDGVKPAGTPGKQNANYSENLPPIIQGITFTPQHPAPGQPIQVEADVRDPDGLREVKVRYRTAGSGSESAELMVLMQKTSPGRFAATIPGQKADQLVRFRIEALDATGARRLTPGESEPRPAFSCFVHEPFQVGQIPFGIIIHVDEAEFKAAQAAGNQQRGRGMTEEDRNRWTLRYLLESGLDVEGAWFQLAIQQQLGFEAVQQLKPLLQKKLSERAKLIETAESTSNLPEEMKAAPDRIKSFQRALLAAIQPMLSQEQNKALSQWQEQRLAPAAGNDLRRGPEPALRQLLRLESYFSKASTLPGLDEAQYAKLHELYRSTFQERAGYGKTVQAAMNGDGNWEEIQAQISTTKETFMLRQKAILTQTQEQLFAAWRREASPQPSRRAAPPAPSQSAQGRSAFIYVSAQTGEPELFDFVKIRPRGGGFKVHFLKDHPALGMTAFNLIFEGNDRFILAERLAYEVYRRVGNAAPLSDFVRVYLDGKSAGYHLLIEQPNRHFLRRNHLDDEGNLYKILWYEQDVVGQHEKKTHWETGHEDLLNLLDRLEKTKGEEQWAVIKQEFNVEQVINYFAVNMCLSHWDGFFNNYFTYHDVKGTGKWEMYAWDQDKTWGFHDGLPEGGLFYDMPVTFGMEGDRPPGWPQDRPPPKGMGAVSHDWWRPGGYFSRPLLTNPQFRKHFLARTKEILETIYTEDVFVPIIESCGKQLQEEVGVRAEATRENPKEAADRLQRNLQSLREHLTKRRQFLLQQEEIRSAGKFVRSDLR